MGYLEDTGNNDARTEGMSYGMMMCVQLPFDKFVYAKRDLGTQMKATGEVMAIGQSFEEALLKAVRGARAS